MLSSILFYLFISLFTAFLITLLIVGFFLLFRVKETKLYNLIWVGIAFILIPIGFIGNFLFGLGIIFENIFVSTGFVLSVIFTNQTFHKKKKYTKSIVLCLVIFLAIYFSILDIYYPKIGVFFFYLRRIIDISLTFLTFGWMGWSSYEAYRRIKNSDIQPWIKSRYKIIAVVSFILSSHAIPSVFVSPNVLGTDFSNESVLISYIIIAIISLIFSIGFCIAWIMPTKLKKYFNRNFHPNEEKEIPEDEIIKLIKNELIGGNKRGNN